MGSLTDQVERRKQLWRGQRQGDATAVAAEGLLG